VNIEDLINELKNDKKKLGGVCCCLFLILLLAAGMTNVQDLNNTNINVTTTTAGEDLFNKSTAIRTSGWDYTPEGFPLIGKDVYGSCEGVTSNGEEHTYFFTGKQMAALGNISDYTFEYNDLHIIAEKNSNDHWIVTHMFYKNGTEIPLNWDEYDFAAYAKIAGANNPNCEAGFGYTTDEVNKMEG